MNGLTPEETLGLAIVGLILLECLGWLRDGTIRFDPAWWGGGGLRARRSGLFSGPDQAGLTLSNPWPWSRAARAEPWALCPTRRGLGVIAPSSLSPFGRVRASGRFLVWESPDLIEARERTVTMGGRIVARLGSNATARLLAVELRRLAASPEGERDEAIDDWVNRSVDVQ